MKTTVSICVAAACICSGAVSASIATFDSLAEGDLGYSFTDGGITFSDLYDGTGSGPITFACETADGTLSGPGFSPTNALGFAAWAPGPFAGFSQCSSFSFTTGSVQTFASIDIFEWLSPGGNIVSLQAFHNGVMVASSSVTLPGDFQLNHFQLSVSGVAFDTLRLQGSGPSSYGTFIGLVDNVVVAPAPASALGVALMCLCPRRRRQ